MLQGTKSGFLNQWKGNYQPQLESIFNTVVYFRIPLAIAFLAFVIFPWVPQTVEIYRSIAQDNDILKAVLSTTFVFLLSLLIWYAGRLFSYQDYRKEVSLNADLLTGLPRILGLVPLASFSLGIFRSIDGQQLFSWIWIVACFVALGMYWGLVTSRRKIFAQGKLDFLGKSKTEGLFSPEVEIAFANFASLFFSAFSVPLIHSVYHLSVGVFAVFLLWLLLNLLMLFWHWELRGKIARWAGISLLVFVGVIFLLPPLALPNFLGSLSIVAIALSISMAVLGTIYNFSRQNKFPAAAVLILLLVVSSAFNWNDNHKFRQTVAPASQPLPSLEESFQQWLSSRPDLEAFADKPYPVYLVSAQGGGIFAAYHAATALANLQDRFPNFAQHIFAISSVSGGSIGASFFSSLIQATGDRDIALAPPADRSSDCTTRDLGPLATQACQLLDRDFLSPLLALGLFPDLVQRFLPVPINQWDRALGLETGVELSWDGIFAGPNLLKQSYFQHWQPEGIAPALAINTTVVETGERLAISPFAIPLSNGESISLAAETLDLTLSTAAGLSARFPIVTPVGWYRRGDDGVKYRLADGGYYDNSGVATALDMGRAIAQATNSAPTSPQIELIYLAIVDKPNNKVTANLEGQGLNELFSPVRAALNVRSARGKNIVQRAEYLLNAGSPDEGQSLRFRKILLQKQLDGDQLPLGWLLSETSQKIIDQQNLGPEGCNFSQFLDERNGRKDIDVFNHNRCVAKLIEEDLAAK